MSCRSQIEIIAMVERGHPLGGVATDAVGDLGVVQRRGVKAALLARAIKHPRPIFGVRFDGLGGHGTSVAATSRSFVPAPDAIGSPWPKQAVSTSSAANR